MPTGTRRLFKLDTLLEDDVMEGLLSLLLFGLFFFLMMRFGCGAHIMHGGHGGHAHGESAGKDPVCGMEVSENSGYSKAQQGQTYRFCSRSCLDKFDREPDGYVSQADMKEAP